MPNFKVTWESTNSNPNPIWSFILNVKDFDAAIKEAKTRAGNSINILSATQVDEPTDTLQYNLRLALKDLGDFKNVDDASWYKDNASKIQTILRLAQRIAND
jgi:hypothetical protein